MDGDDETATYEAPPGAPGEVKPGPRRPAPLQVRDPGRYEIIAEHGRGGIGRVLRATDREFGRDVALKELLIRTAVSETRFLREALITARLEHPNIVPVHEAGRWPDGTPFYAMKLVSGRPLKALIDLATTTAERLALLDRVVAVTDAVAYAHDRGVIHRDLKPSNIIVGEYGETIVIDWGLAKMVSDAEGRPDDAAEETSTSTTPDVTTAGTVLGTPAYMPPEQAAGGFVDERSDIYSLGAILLEVLGGMAARLAATKSASVSGITTEAGSAENPSREAVAGMPPDLLSIAHKALSSRPEDRYPTARAFGEDIRRFLAGQPVVAHRYTVRQRATRWLAAHRRLVASVGAAVVALFAASVWFLAREASLRNVAEGARATAEAERDRADRQTLALLEQQGRTELAAARPFRAAPFLAEAYRRDPDNEPVRWLLTESLHALDALAMTFDVTPSAADDKLRDPYTYTVSLSPDDSEMVTGHSRSIAFWDAATGAFRRRQRTGWKENLTVHSGDGTRLFVRVRHEKGNAPVHVLDAATGRALRAFHVGDDIRWVSWSPDGQYVAVLHNAGHVAVWSTSSAKIVLSFPGAPRPVLGSVAFSPDSSLLAAGRTEELILVSMRTREVRRISSIGEGVRIVEFAPDSRHLATTMDDRSARIWDTARSQVVATLPQHANQLVLVSFSTDSSMLATVEADGALHLWDVASTIRLVGLTPQTNDDTEAIRFAHRTPRLVTATDEGLIRFWDVPRERWARSLPDHRGPTRAAYAAGGARIITLDHGEDGKGRLRVWRTSDYEIEHSSTIAWNPACRIGVSADGRRVAVGTLDNRATVVDAATGEVLTAIDGGEDRIFGVALSPDASILAIATPMGNAHLWSALDGKPTGIELRPADTGMIRSVAFSPDGTRILTTGHGKWVRLWDARSGQMLAESPNSESVYATFSADGRRFITGGWGGEYRPQVWDAATGRSLVTLASYSSAGGAAALSADGALAATSDDGMIQISSARTGALLRTIAGPTRGDQLGNRAINTIAFSPDGKRLLATGIGYALVWNIEIDTRSPAEADAVVAAKSPWRLVDGRLVRASDSALPAP